MITHKKILALIFLAVFAASAQAAEWHMVPAQSQLKFVATYEGQQAPGVFQTFDVALNFDPEQPQKGSLKVAVKITGADMNSTDINKAIKEPEWFGADQYPLAVFTSQQIDRQAPGQYIAKGTLSLKGIVKSVQVPFTWQTSGDTATMTGHMTLLRTDFNIGTGEWSSGKTIGLEVSLNYTVQLQSGGEK